MIKTGVKFIASRKRRRRVAEAVRSCEGADTGVLTRNEHTLITACYIY